MNAAPMKLDGIHHVTAITGDARANVEFYAGTLVRRLVKKTASQDDTTVNSPLGCEASSSAMLLVEEGSRSGGSSSAVALRFRVERVEECERPSARTARSPRHRFGSC
jgi:catechol 2,3-dioxygenase-like lactoylglutathione lyase family enzyme